MKIDILQAIGVKVINLSENKKFCEFTATVKQLLTCSKSIERPAQCVKSVQS